MSLEILCSSLRKQAPLKIYSCQLNHIAFSVFTYHGDGSINIHVMKSHKMTVVKIIKATVLYINRSVAITLLMKAK